MFGKIQAPDLLLLFMVVGDGLGLCHGFGWFLGWKSPEFLKNGGRLKTSGLLNVADARAKLAGAQSIPERIDAARQMDTALGRLLVIMENYPLLKADATVARLMDELAGTENRIAVERRRYNESVKLYNTTILRFPTRIFASVFGFEKGTYYEIEEAAREVPEVDL